LPRETAILNPLGVILDIPPENIGPDKWSDCINVNFNDKASVRVSGSLDVSGACVVKPVSTIWINFGGVSYWLYASGEGAGIWNGSAHTDITPLDWVAGNDIGLVWSILNGIPVLSYADVGAWYWQPNATPAAMLALPDFAANVGAAASVRPFKNFLIALGVTSTPDRVYWSDAAAPGQVPQSWTPLPENLAGDFTLSDTPGGVIDGLQLRNDFIIYKNNATYLMQFTGGQFVMSQRLLFRSTGVLSQNCVAEWHGKHLCLADGDIVQHDGVTIQSVADAKVRKALFNSLSQDYYRQAFVIHSSKEHEYIVGVPGLNSQGYCNVVGIWDYAMDTWAIRDFESDVGGGAEGLYLSPTGTSGDWDSDLGAWNDDATSWGSTGESPTAEKIILTVPDQSYLLGLIEPVNDRNGQPITARLTSALLDFNQPSHIKMVHRIWPEMTAQAPTTVRMRVGFSNDHGSPPTFSPWRDFDVLNGDKLDFSEQGRYLQLQIESTGGPVWKLHGLNIEYDLAGKF
jgi:hypothetical protein